MTIKLLKESLHQIIENIDDAELLAAYYKILTSGQSSDWWDDSNPEAKESINQGLTELKNGDVLTHEEVMLEVRNLLKKNK
ncbi:MAG: hypothetical protein AAFQ87_24760 [Bacteroidota bacterium]